MRGKIGSRRRKTAYRNIRSISTSYRLSLPLSEPYTRTHTYTRCSSFSLQRQQFFVFVVRTREPADPRQERRKPEAGEPAARPACTDSRPAVRRDGTRTRRCVRCCSWKAIHALSSRAVPWRIRVRGAFVPTTERKRKQLLSLFFFLALEKETRLDRTRFDSPHLLFSFSQIFLLLLSFEFFSLS